MMIHLPSRQQLGQRCTAGQTAMLCPPTTPDGMQGSHGHNPPPVAALPVNCFSGLETYKHLIRLVHIPDLQPDH